MKKRELRDTGASVRARLANISTARGIDFQVLLTRHVIERFLWRMGTSPESECFVVKGAALFALWTQLPQRPTRDLDLLGRGNSDPEHVRRTITTICAQPCDDGVLFRLDTVKTRPIREDEDYKGVRITLDAEVSRAVVKCQIDIGFGDAVTPAPCKATYPTLLDLPAPVVLVYPLETVIAEKFSAMVSLGLSNSRMKDFYDLYHLARTTSFEEDVLRAAITATFSRRGLPVPATLPMALTEEFAQDDIKKREWVGFIRRNQLDAPPFHVVQETIRTLLWPLIQSLLADVQEHRQWQPGSGWSPLRS